MARKAAKKVKKVKKAPKRSGRPRGARNRDLDTVSGEATRCRKCGSTDREPYFGKRTLDYAGTTPDGKPYTRVVWRRTVCRSCGQHRMDKSYEYTPGEPQEARRGLGAI